MISLSFAIEADDDQTIRPVVEEIKKCLDGGISVFAAASNGGPSTRRTFPARQKDVLCIYAGSHDERPYAMNPAAEDDKANFMFLGCDILSSWSGSNADGSARTKGKEYKTGTSYAVPVAVSTAAFMVAYIRCKAPDSVNWNIPPQSPEGLRRIFKAMVTKGKNPTYEWVSPFNCLGNSSDFICTIKKSLSYSK